MADVQLLVGDCREVLKTLPDCSVNCCVTSPPYFGLRSYNGGDAEIGQEQTPDAYVAELVDVFREVKRVLRDDGTLWLNLGDSYSGSNSTKSAAINPNSLSFKMGQTKGGVSKPIGIVDGLKPKDLIGIPWRVAFALQADGWYLRQDIIWHKPNPMPESVTDRCTKAHEYIFLLSKSARYFYDAEAIKEPAETKPHAPGWTGRTAENSASMGSYRPTADGGSCSQYAEPNRTWASDGTRNRRSVWTVSTKPYKEAHFAVFPPKLITPCILAGCPEGGTVLDPFGGSGTTGDVAMNHNRNAILIELNPSYIELQKKRTAQGVML